MGAAAWGKGQRRGAWQGGGAPHVPWHHTCGPAPLHTAHPHASTHLCCDVEGGVAARHAAQRLAKRQRDAVPLAKPLPRAAPLLHLQLRLSLRQQAGTAAGGMHDHTCGAAAAGFGRGAAQVVAALLPRPWCRTATAVRCSSLHSSRKWARSCEMGNRPCSAREVRQVRAAAAAWRRRRRWRRGRRRCCPQTPARRARLPAFGGASTP